MSENKLFKIAGAVLTIFFIVSCGYNTKKSFITISNHTSIDYENYTLLIQLDDLTNSGDFFKNELFQITDGDQEIPWQKLKDKNALLIEINLTANSQKKLFVSSNQPNTKWEKKTQAELWYKTGGEFINSEYTGGGDFVKSDSLRVPDECTDHSFYIKYEGPGWESDKVGYRFYLDWRNAVDVYGKKTTDMVLQNVGQDGYESYHEMADWGMDILKVGSSLGLGTIAFWNGDIAERVEKTDSVICKIQEDGILYPSVIIGYNG